MTNRPTYLLKKIGCSTFCTLKTELVDYKNGTLVLNNQSSPLPFLSEVTCIIGPNTYSGIVTKLDAQTHVSVYDPLMLPIMDKEVTLQKQPLTWKNSYDTLYNNILTGQVKANAMVDVHGKWVTSQTQTTPHSESPKKSTQFVDTQPAKKKIWTSSPILNICYDIFYGEMTAFVGCRGSGRKTAANSLIDGHSSSSAKAITFYINNKPSKPIASKSIVFFNENPTNANVYMTTLKALNLAERIKKDGYEVLLVIDELKSILIREWNMQQSLSNSSKNSKNNSSSYTPVNSSLYSILNEIYAKTDSNKKGGSLTSIVMTQNDSETVEHLQEITPFTNNLKHMTSLCQTIQFPVKIKANHRLWGAPQNQNSYSRLRETINRYILEKKKAQLQLQLYSQSMRDEPWEYYFLLDSEWWLKGLKDLNFPTQKQEHNFLEWLCFNIDEELSPKWNCSCQEAYRLYTSYLDHNGHGELDSTQMERFLGWARMEGKLSPFRKDYLH